MQDRISSQKSNLKLIGQPYLPLEPAGEKANMSTCCRRSGNLIVQHLNPLLVLRTPEPAWGGGGGGGGFLPLPMPALLSLSQAVREGSPESHDTKERDIRSYLKVESYICAIRI